MGTWGVLGSANEMRACYDLVVSAKDRAHWAARLWARKH